MNRQLYMTKTTIGLNTYYLGLLPPVSEPLSLEESIRSSKTHSRRRKNCIDGKPNHSDLFLNLVCPCCCSKPRGCTELSVRRHNVPDECWKRLNGRFTTDDGCAADLIICNMVCDLHHKDWYLGESLKGAAPALRVRSWNVRVEADGASNHKCHDSGRVQKPRLGFGFIVSLSFVHGTGEREVDRLTPQ